MKTVNKSSVNIRPFLKWAGNKYRIREKIIELLPNVKTLVEPFVGSAAVFLNTNFEHYILSDNNSDLINLFQYVQAHGDNYIDLASHYFKPEYNNPEAYYRLRDEFNTEHLDKGKKAALFLYFNRHGFNGLCRYNKKGYFNVPFGLIHKPYFPASEIQAFYQKSQNAEFRCCNFVSAMSEVKPDAVVYCDPPYLPLSESAYFTQYTAQKFTLEHHKLLAKRAQELAKCGIAVLISNHDNALARELYLGEKYFSFSVPRFISAVGSKRTRAQELLILYSNHLK